MQKVAVSNIAKQIRGVSYKPVDLHNDLNKDSVILLRANNISGGKINFDDVVYVDKKKVSSEQYLQKGDILICASSGSKNLVGKAASVSFDIKCTFGAFCKVIRPISKYANYLGMYFQSDIYRRIISNVAIGANINNIRNEHIDSLELSIYSDDKNNEIVSILDKLQSIITHRRTQLEKLDLLVKARFVEMFGTLLKNPNNYPITTIAEVCSLIKDGTHQTPEYTDDIEEGYKFLSSKDVMSQKIDWSNIKYIPQTLHEKLYSTLKPQKNDILMSKNGVNYGVAAVNDTEEVFDIYVSLALLRPLDIINPIFFRCAINNPDTKMQFDGSIKGIGVPNLHLGEIKKTKILLPPLNEQKEYVTFVKQVDKSKATVQKALDEAQLLFDSLMQEYFG